MGGLAGLLVWLEDTGLNHRMASMESVTKGLRGLCHHATNSFLWANVYFRSRCAGVQIFHDQLFTEVGAPFEETLLHFFHEAGDFWVA